MQKKTLQEAKIRLTRNRNRQIRKRIISALACIVVFFTTYALILPAITLEKNQCGKTEHTHTEACYSQGTTHSVKKPICSVESLEIHEHTEDCYDKDGNLICGFADFVIHEHDSACYDENGKLWCELPEIEEHIHTKNCYDNPEKVEVHKHTDKCYTTQRGELTCTRSETPHTHTKDCYTESKTLVCSKPESDGHHHSEDCHDESGELICGQKENDGHHHGADCYKISSELTCKLSEESHKHTEECYARKKVLTCNISEGSLESGGAKLICGKDEIISHKHTKKSCYETDKNGNTYLICDKPEILEHQHTDDCFETVEETVDDKELICGMEEHTHTDECREKAETTDANALTLESRSDPHAVANISAANVSEVQPRSIMRFAVRRNATARGLENYITGVTLQHKVNGRWEDISNGGTVNKGESIRFKLNYQLPGNILTEENNSITYQLPDAIVIAQAESGKVYDNAGVEVGDYTISQNGEVVVAFNDEYVKNNQQGHAISGFVAVEANVNDIHSEGNNIDISFGTDLNVNVTITDPDQDKSDISVQKKDTEVDDKNGTVKYTITVNSNNGTGDKVHLKDIMKNIELDGDVTITGPGQDASAIRTDDGFTIELPKMNAGESYTITYTAKLPRDSVADVTANNRVHVESSKKDGSKIESSSSVDTSFKQTYVSKTGQKNGDKIIWTITVNEGKNDISGWTLKDVFNDVEFNGSVTVKGSNGKIITTTNLPYTFPANSKDTYTITYETPAEKPLGGNQAKNHVELTPQNGPGASDDKYVDVGESDKSYNPLSKKSESLTVNEDGTATLKWKVTIDAKEGDISAPWFYRDRLENGYFTEQQIQAVESRVANAVNGKGLGYTFEKTEENGKIVGYKLNFTSTLKKGQQFSFTYESTADLQGGDKEITFKNTGNINDKVWSSGSTQYKPLVKKYDANNSGNARTEHNYYDQVMNENGTLKWGIDVTLPQGYQGGDLTVTEKLPEGVTLTKLAMKAEGLCAEVDITSAGAHQVNGQNVTTAQTGQTVTITIPESIVQNENLKTIKFFVQAKINDDFDWPKVDGKPVASFENEVEVTSRDGKTHGTSEQTQTITKDNSQPVISKGHDPVNDNIIPYSLIVNPDGRDLLEGSDTLTLIDTLKVDTRYTATNTTVSLVPGSVKVYHLNADGTKGEQIESGKVPYTQKITEEGNESNPYTQYLLKMSLPDKTPLVVEYKYKVNSPDIGSAKQISNAARLEGVGNTGEESTDQIRIDIVDSSAGATVDGITIVKVDNDNYGITLKGAKFELYGYNKDTKEYELQGEYTTPDNGRISLSGLSYNTAYCLKEIDAPDNYLKPEELYYFYITNSDTTHYPEVKPEGFSGQKYNGGDTVYIPNESKYTTIQVDKRWFSSDGKDITATKGGNISFELYRKESTTKPAGGASGGKVSLRWRVYSYGSILGGLDRTETDIPVGSTVKVTATASQDTTTPPEKMLINKEQVTMAQEEGTLNFSYTFTINEETDVQIWSWDWHFQTPGNYTVTWEPPQASESTTSKGTKVGSYTISGKNGWRWSSKDEESLKHLPKTGVAEDGKTTVYYTYYVKEAAVTGYETSCENNDGIVSGTITIKNTGDEQPSYELPETGDSGTTPYTVGGLATICTGLFLLYFSRKRKKENLAWP